MSAPPPITADPPAAPDCGPDRAPAAAALDGTSIPTPANPAPPSAPAAIAPTSASNSTPPTSPLSTEAILRALHAAAFNLVETADSLNIPLSRLVALLDQPETDAAVTSLQNASRKCLELRAVQARTSAITILEKLARETEDPIEQRRSAIALVRATILRNLSVAPAVPPREPETPRSTTLPPPRPRASPSPDLTPEKIVETIEAALRKPDDPDPSSAPATVHRFLAPGATLNNVEIPRDPAEAVEMLNRSLLSHAYGTRQSWTISPRPPLPGDPPDPRHRVRLSLVTVPDFRTNHKRMQHDFTFIRSTGPPHENCYLISRITIAPRIIPT